MGRCSGRVSLAVVREAARGQRQQWNRMFVRRPEAQLLRLRCRSRKPPRRGRRCCLSARRKVDTAGVMRGRVGWRAARSRAARRAVSARHSVGWNPLPPHCSWAVPIYHVSTRQREPFGSAQCTTCGTVRVRAVLRVGESGYEQRHWSLLADMWLPSWLHSGNDRIVLRMLLLFSMCFPFARCS